MSTKRWEMLNATEVYYTESVDGPWVKHSDHEAQLATLQAQNAELVEMLKALYADCCSDLPYCNTFNSFRMVKNYLANKAVK